VAPKNIGQQLYARPSRHVGQAYQPRMLRAAVDKPSEVGVDCDENSVLAGRHADDGLVARIRSQPGYLDHVMPLCPEPLRQTMARTAINEEFHLASLTASSESSASTACA
jgi:hypothetical protein